MPNTPRRITGYGSLLLAAATAVWMYTRAQSEQLWAYGPLVLYFSLYAGVFLLATYRADGNVRKRNILSTGSGLLLGFGFPGYLPFPFLLLIALVPLLYLAKQLRTADAPVRTVLAHGFSTFVLYNLLATYWVTNTGFFAGLFAIVVNAGLMCIPWLFYYWTAKRSPNISYLAFAAAWISFEFLHHNWSLNWPWLTLGNGFMQFPEVVQWYEITGVFGGSVWILAVNYLAYRASLAIYQPDLAPARRRPNYYLLALVLLPVLGSLIRFWRYAEPPGKTVTVAAIQPNLEPHFEKFNGQREAQLDTFLELSQAALTAGPVDYLLYPETSFDYVVEDDPLANGSLLAASEGLYGKEAKYLMTGVDGYHIFGPGEPVSPAVRYQRRSSGDIAYEAINGAVQINLESGDDTQTYRKGVFVPGAESFPFKNVLFFMEPLVNSLGGTVAGRGTQEKRTPFRSETAAIAPVICYESVFGEYFTGYIKEGAQAAFVMTNDGWWDNTAGYRQHLWLSSLRAVETRRAVVRSANVGACAFIDQRGVVQSRTPYDQAGFLRGEVKLNDAVTPYVRFGDILARIAVLIFTMTLLTNIARTVRPAAFARDDA